MRHEQAMQRFSYERVQGPTMNNEAFVVTDKNTGTSYFLVEKYGAVELRNLLKEKE
jgi:hypothetical protein